MGDKPDDLTPPYPSGAFSAFSETELVDPGPLGAAYFPGYVLRDGTKWWLGTERPAPLPAEPTQPAAIVEGDPPPRETMATAWASTKRPSTAVVNVARRMLEELADGFMQGLLFGQELVEAWFVLKFGLPRIIALEQEDRDPAAEASEAESRVQPWLVAGARTAAFILDDPPGWLWTGLQKTMGAVRGKRDNRPSPAELRDRLTNFLKDAHRLDREPVSPEMHAALLDMIARAEKAQDDPSINKGARGIRTHDQEYAAFAVMRAWLLTHDMKSPAKRDVTFWMAAGAYLEEAGGASERRGGRKSKPGDDEEDEPIPVHYEAHCLPDENNPGLFMPQVRMRSGADEKTVWPGAKVTSYSEGLGIAQNQSLSDGATGACSSPAQAVRAG
jgi:hypothetical protein